MPEPKLHVVTATLAVTITVDGQPIKLDLNRVMREPSWMVQVIDQHPALNIAITQSPASDEEYAEIQINIERSALPTA